jgi:hypothetical protein
MRARSICCSVAVLLIAGCGETESTEDPSSAAPPAASVRAEPATHPVGPGPVDQGKATDTKPAGEDSAKTLLEQDKPKFFPVVHTIAPDDSLTKTGVYRKIAEGLGVFAFRRQQDAGPDRPLDYVLKSELAKYALTDDQLIDLCYGNFSQTHIMPRFSKQGEDMVVHIESSGGYTASLIGRPSTYETLSKILHKLDLALYVGAPSYLIATGKGSRFEAVLFDLAAKERAKGGTSGLVPTVYYWLKDQTLVPATKK